MKIRIWLASLPLSLFLCTCGSAHLPPKKIRLPKTIKEASGLVIEGDRLTWHNDSGDGPFVYTTNLEGDIIRVDTLAAGASDYEDITRDPAGRLYVADTGNNRGRRTEALIYRYDRALNKTDTIRFHYPGQNGAGRAVKGNYDCEAMVFMGGHLHLFTKDQLGGRGSDAVLHFRVPAHPGNYEAELVDSLHLPRRVVTAAALDTVRGQLVMTSYTFKMFLGLLPTSAASLITFEDFTGDRFLRGTPHRKNLSWGPPTQYEAVDFYNEEWLYVASEGTVVRPVAVAKRKRRR